MVGLTAALALAQLDFRVAVLEGREPQLAPWADAFDIRVSAINRASQSVFQNLQAWSAMRELGVFPYQRMHVWEAAGSAAIHFEGADVGRLNLGHIVENRVMLQALWQQVQSNSNISLMVPAQAEYIDVYHDHVRIALANRSLSALVVIGADGGNSWVRQQMGVHSHDGDYQQSALVATVKLEKPHQECAWQVFRHLGPLALLPMRDNHCSIVWSSTSQEAQGLLHLPEADFNYALMQAVDEKFGAMNLNGERALFALRHRHSDRYVKPRIALIGDAAHTIHPLAGQGVNLGILDAACLVQVLASARRATRDVGLHSVLRQYERWRRGNNAIMLNSMTGINQLYQQESDFLVQCRNTGVRFADSFQPLKQFFVRQAMGMHADLPKLARA